MTDITPEMLAQLRRLCEEASLGPWPTGRDDLRHWLLAALDRIGALEAALINERAEREDLADERDTAYDALNEMMVQRDAARAEAEHSANFAKAEADARDALERSQS